ncbi:MAG: preprotein translocase subunit SecE [Firmicutes bacterium]|nr:preprotein translocase subunit SecE [Bacillota bacterium]
MANEEKKDQKELVSSKIAVKREDKKLNIFQRIGRWFRDMRSELRKVVWSTPKQVVNNTAIALLFMGVAAIVIWGFDFAADRVIQALIAVAGAGR